MTIGKRLLLSAVLPGAFLAVAVASRALLAHAPVRVATDLAQPLPVVTNWGAFGAVLLGVLVAALAIGTIAYERLIARDDRGVLVVCASAIAVAWLVPVLYSSDVYAYALYGELAALGSNPYAHAMLPHGDPIFDAAVWQWGNPPPACVYGPLFVALAEAIVVALRAAGTVAQLDGLRALACVSLVGCAALAYRAYPGTQAQRAAAAATIGANPVAIWCAVEGHNDAVALAFAIGGFAVLRSGWPGFGASLAALAGTIKFPGVVAAVPLAFADLRTRIGAAAGIVTTLLVCVPLFEGAVTRMVPQGRYAPQASLQAIVKPLAFTVFSTDERATVATWIVAAIAAGLCARPAVALLRGGNPAGWAYLACGAWLLIPNPYPWYGLWLLPIAALAPGSNAAAVLLWLPLAATVRYVPDAVAASSPLAAGLMGIVAILPYAALIERR
jgi:hypothetical protein